MLFSLGKTQCFEKRVVPSCYCVKHKMVTNQSPFFGSKIVPEWHPELVKN